MPRNIQVSTQIKKSPATKTALKPVARPSKKASANVAAVKEMPYPTPKDSPKLKPKASGPKKAAAKAAGSASNPVATDPLKVVTGKAKAKAVTREPKPPKQKLVRDSFTFPQAEYLVLEGMKKKLLADGNDAKKGELVRAGIALLAQLDDEALVKALASVEKLKTGRPAK